MKRKFVINSLLLGLFCAKVGLSFSQDSSIHCEKVSLDTPGIQSVIQKFLDRPSTAFVRKCGDGDLVQYFGATKAIKIGNVCSYELLKLDVANSNLRSVDRSQSETKYRLVSKSKCPAPDSGKYAVTHNVSADIYEQIVSAWTIATSSSVRLSDAVSQASNSIALERLSAMIANGKGQELIIVRVSVETKSPWRAQYRVDVADPLDQGSFFGVLMSRRLGGAFEILDLGRGFY